MFAKRPMITVRVATLAALAAFAAAAQDVNCVMDTAPQAIDCTCSCGTLTQDVSVAQSGEGNACPTAETHVCLNGHGACSIVESCANTLEGRQNCVENVGGGNSLIYDEWTRVSDNSRTIETFLTGPRYSQGPGAEGAYASPASAPDKLWATATEDITNGLDDGPAWFAMDLGGFTRVESVKLNWLSVPAESNEVDDGTYPTSYDIQVALVGPVSQAPQNGVSNGAGSSRLHGIENTNWTTVHTVNIENRQLVNESSLCDSFRVTDCLEPEMVELKLIGLVSSEQVETISVVSNFGGTQFGYKMARYIRVVVNSGSDPNLPVMLTQIKVFAKENLCGYAGFGDAVNAGGGTVAWYTGVWASDTAVSRSCGDHIDTATSVYPTRSIGLPASDKWGCDTDGSMQTGTWVDGVWLQGPVSSVAAGSVETNPSDGTAEHWIIGTLPGTCKGSDGVDGCSAGCVDYELGDLDNGDYSANCDSEIGHMEQCEVTCDSCYHQVGTVLPSCVFGVFSDGYPEGSDAHCEEITCAPYTFQENVQGKTGSDNACVDGIQLTTVGDNNCWLECGHGYFDQSKLLSCPCSHTEDQLPPEIEGVSVEGDGNGLVCVPEPCSSSLGAGNGYGTECAGLVTDGAACIQTCTAGYTATAGSSGGEITCPAGTLTGTPVECAETESEDDDDNDDMIWVPIVAAVGGSGLLVAAAICYRKNSRGRSDVMPTTSALDTTGDGKVDHIAIDTTGDGKVDTVLPLTPRVDGKPPAAE